MVEKESPVGKRGDTQRASCEKYMILDINTVVHSEPTESKPIAAKKIDNKVQAKADIQSGRTLALLRSAACLSIDEDSGSIVTSELFHPFSPVRKKLTSELSKNLKRRKPENITGYHPPSWRYASDELKHVFICMAMFDDGKAPFTFDVDLGDDQANRAISHQGGFTDFFHREASKSCKRQLRRNPDRTMTPEMGGRTGHLHFHGAASIYPEELADMKVALRAAAGAWSNGKNYQVKSQPIKPYLGDVRRRSRYPLKDVAATSDAIPGRLTRTTNPIRSRAKVLYDNFRQQIRQLVGEVGQALKNPAEHEPIDVRLDPEIEAVMDIWRQRELEIEAERELNRR